MLRTRQALGYSLLADVSAVGLLLGGYSLMNAITPEWRLIGSVLVGVGVVTLLLGAYLFTQAAARIARVQRFRARGRKLIARVLRVEHIVTPDDDTYELVVETRDDKTGETRLITSDPLPEHPGMGIEGSNVDVLVDPDRPDECLVDVRPYKKRRSA